MERNQNDRKRYSQQIRKNTVDILILDTLSRIMRTGGDPEDFQYPLKINSHLDLIIFSGEYNYKELQQKLGPLRVDDTFVPDNRAPNYRTKLIKNFKKGIYMVIFINPIKGHYPYCRMEIHQKNIIEIKTMKNFIKDLAKDFPMLTVSKVEYANDIYCLDSDDVENLFYIIQRHFYVPYVRTMPKPDSNENEKKEMSRFYRLGSEKAYERGDNKKRRGKGWQKEDLDRIRIEHTADRKQLRKHGINKISDLLRDPKFYEINKKTCKFVNFERSKKLPKYYDSYNSDPLYPNSFQAEFIYYKKKLKTLTSILLLYHTSRNS